MTNNDNTVSLNPEAVHTQSASLVGHAESLRTSNEGFVNGLAAVSPGWVGSSAQALDSLIGHGAQHGSHVHNRLHGTANGMRGAADGLSDQDDRNRRNLGGVQTRDTVQAVD